MNDDQNIYNLQFIIYSELERLKDNYPDEYVPQFKLWNSILQHFFSLNQEIEERTLYTRFLTALLGHKNSFSLFECAEDLETSEMKWKNRKTNDEAQTKFEKNGLKIKSIQVLSLQEKLKKIQNQNKLLEIENRKYDMFKERMRISASQETQNSFYIYEVLTSIIEQYDISFDQAHTRMNRINDKVSDVAEFD